MGTSVRVTGKIILSGEYAVVFGHRGIAIPSKESMETSWVRDEKAAGVSVVWESGDPGAEWMAYAKSILDGIESVEGALKGTLVIRSGLPLGKGMGSSTALIVGIARAVLGDDSAKIALSIENALSPDNSGIDFAVIWEGKPILYQKDEEPQVIDLDPELWNSMTLIDTGMPNERTLDLVAWVKERYATDAGVKAAIETIGRCTDRILNGEDLKTVIRDHHRAQIALGVVPESAQKVIADIEAKGGAAKVIGAGGRTGGGGMVLALH